jgi:hypothetical protein
MLIETAFGYFPEILCGSNYEIQRYEAGLVNALSLAMLQELNARNIANPLSCITVEKPYSKEGFEREGGGKRRHLRLDLFLNTSRNPISTPQLYRFGWRDLNYVEAKFFRSPPSEIEEAIEQDDVRGDVNGNAADLLTDLIRLCCLTPPDVQGWTSYIQAKEAAKDTSPRTMWVPYDTVESPTPKYGPIDVGRYLLHVYHGDPTNFTGERDWVKKLRTPGPQDFKLRVGDDTEGVFVQNVSEKLKELTIGVDLDNRVIKQASYDNKIIYTCVLTRITSFKVELAGHEWLEGADGIGIEKSIGDWKAIMKMVGSRIGATRPKKKSLADLFPITSFETGSFSGATQSGSTFVSTIKFPPAGSNAGS